MRQEPDIGPEQSGEEEAERVSRELGDQIERARSVLREYQSTFRPLAAEDLG